MEGSTIRAGIIVVQDQVLPVAYRPQNRNTKDVEYSSCYPPSHHKNSGINSIMHGEALKDFKHRLAPVAGKCYFYYSEISDQAPSMI